MTKTQRIDALRNIRKQGASFLSIVMIALLAVNAYLGIAYSAKALNRNVTDYYDEHNAHDFSVYSPLLLTDEDLLAIRGLEGVADVEGCFETSAWISSEEFGATAVSVLSVPERISMPVMQEGRLPENEHEAAVEVKLMEKQGLSIGDRIHIANQAGGTPDLMAETEFTVTGVFYHPDHINLDFMIPPYLLVTENAFDQDLLNGAYPRARVRMAETPNDRFTDAYWRQAEPVEQALKELSKERSPRRGSEVWERYEQEIADGEAQLAEAKTALEDADRQLADGEAQIQEYDEQLQDGRKQIEEAEQQLLDADEQIAEAERKLREAEEEHADDIARLDEAKEELRKAAEELGIAPDQLAAGEAQLAEAQRQLERGKEELDAAKATLDDSINQIESGIKEVKDEILSYDDFDSEAAILLIEYFYPDIVETLPEDIRDKLPAELPEDVLEKLEEYKGLERDEFVARAETDGRAWLYEVLGINAGLDQYEEGMKQYREGLMAYEFGRANYYYMGEEYLDGLLAYEKGRKQVAEAELQLQELYDARAELEAKKRELEDARATLQEKRQELADGQQKLEEARAELEENRKLYEEKLSEYESYRKQISDARKLLEQLEDGAWTVLNAHADQGYIFNESNANTLSSMSLTISMVFIVVAAMVIYAGVGRMVDEQSKLVGVTKALGLYNREILNKYLVFGLGAACTGMILGVLVASYAMQRVILIVYKNYYHLSLTKTAFLPAQTLLVLAGGILLAVLAVRFATARLLRSTSITLMNGTPPRLVRMTGKAGGGLYSRLIRLNMLSDMKRVIVTVVSVVGCCTLLMAGFGVKFAVGGVPAKQFGEVMVYDAELSFDTGNPTVERELTAYLEEAGIDCLPLLQEDLMLLTGDTLSMGKIICVEPDKTEGFVNLRDVKGKTVLTLPEHGILIPKRLSESYGLQSGDTVTLFDERMNGRETEVSGVYNNYFLFTMVMTPQSYEEIFGSAAERNTMFVKLNGTDFSEFLHDVQSIDGVLSVTEDVGRAQMESGTNAMNAVVAMMIVAAGLMAYFIQVNLTESYMIHKRKELTVMRINGFTVKECVRYASREMTVTTVLGILLGLPVGAFFGYLVIRGSEAEYMQFVRSVDLRSVIFSVLITALFSALINANALKKIRMLKLSDV